MKIIFLDIDGVMNNGKFFQRIYNEFPNENNSKKLDPNSVEALNFVLEKTDAKIVISSSWRKLFTLDEIVEIMKDQGVKNTNQFLGVTNTSSSGIRSKEIQSWIDNNEVKSFVVIDDDAYDLQKFSEQLIKTDWSGDGFTIEHAKEVVERLK